MRARRNPGRIPAWAALPGVLVVLSAVFAGPHLWAAKKPVKTKPKPKPTVSAAAVTSKMVVLGFNDLGMHCMNPEFSAICILPPYNTLHAQVIDRSGEEPRIVTSGIQVKYSIPGNTRSSNKTNFWQYAQALFGLKSPLPADVGLTGSKLSGTMTANRDGDWSVVGIPVTPITDQGVNNPFQLSLIQALSNGKVVGQTQAVVPVSWEISCNICHQGASSVEIAADILTKHDRRHGTSLVAQALPVGQSGKKPVLCASCHADPALGTPGVAGVKTMSAAMHGSHADRMGPALSYVQNACYACHPGKQTECLRDVHFLNGMSCADCHSPQVPHGDIKGAMLAVGDVKRRPWVDEPKCASCHRRPGFAFEEPGKLYKESRGHNGVKCASCHGSPHAITPTAVAADNVQAIAVQGHAGTINDCKVCHRQTPGERFNHTLDD
ncbi:MAG: hypothetical protein U0835_01405 [Isosphaeraceae bacterium]